MGWGVSELVTWKRGRHCGIPCLRGDGPAFGISEAGSWVF